MPYIGPVHSILSGSSNYRMMFPIKVGTLDTIFQNFFSSSASRRANLGLKKILKKLCPTLREARHKSLLFALKKRFL